MKLVVTEKGAESAKEAEHIEHQKRGKRSRNKGSQYERVVAKKFKSAYGADLVRTPQSGGFAKNYVKSEEFRGDIVSADATIDLKLHIECKNTKTWKLPEWFNQAESDCPKGRIPVVIFHKYNTSKDYIALSLEDFFSIVPRDSIIHSKEVQ